MGVGAGTMTNVGSETFELKEKIATLERYLKEQNSKIKDLALQIERLNEENTEYKYEIASLKQQIENLKEDALKEKKITQEKEATYQERILALESKVSDLEKQLEEKNIELEVARLKTMQSMEGARVAILTDPAVHPENISESPKIPATKPDFDFSETVSFHSGYRQKNNQASSDDKSRWKY